MTKTDLRAFLGLVGYYHQFINKFQPPHSAAIGPNKKDHPDRMAWTAEWQHHIKHRKTTAPSLFRWMHPALVLAQY